MYKIKCRAWDATSNSWVNGWREKERDDVKKEAPSWEYYVRVTGDQLIIDCSGNRVIVTQYTEINDKKGVESCQKDVCNDEIGRFMIEKHEGDWVRMYMGTQRKGSAWLMLSDDRPFLIIGNAFENPELLGE